VWSAFSQKDYQLLATGSVTEQYAAGMSVLVMPENFAGAWRVVVAFSPQGDILASGSETDQSSYGMLNTSKALFRMTPFVDNRLQSSRQSTLGQWQL